MKNVSQIHCMLSNALSSVARNSNNYPPSNGPVPRVEKKPAVTTDKANLSMDKKQEKLSTQPFGIKHSNRGNVTRSAPIFFRFCHYIQKCDCA